MSTGIYCGIGLMAYSSWGEAIRQFGSNSPEAHNAKDDYEYHIRLCLVCQAGREIMASEQGNIRESKEWPELQAWVEENDRAKRNVHAEPIALSNSQ